jgi:5-methyltetrahydrofolate--homocysteine methyltransferase
MSGGDSRFAFTPRKVEAVFPIADCPIPLTGEDIKEYLRGCSAVKISAVTLGEECDRELRRLQITDMATALEFDMAANKVLCGSGAGFSPGYGDFPLSASRDIIEVLDASKRIGLCLTDSLFLTPQKSVTRITRIEDIT